MLLIEVVSYRVRVGIVKYVKTVVSEAGLDVFASLANILYFTFFAGNKIYDVSGGTISEGFAMKFFIGVG